MSFLKTSTSFTRFRITDPVPASLWPTIEDKLRQYSFKDIDELPHEERSHGWTAFDDMLDVYFNHRPVKMGGDYIIFALRLDTRRVPPAVAKKHLAIALKKEELLNRDQGKKFVSRERKKELKEQVMLRLKGRTLPIPAEFQVVWNTTESTVYFASTQAKMLEMFQEYFTLSFDLHLEPLTPYELAAKTLGDPAPLDTLEPTKFA